MADIAAIEAEIARIQRELSAASAPAPISVSVPRRRSAPVVAAPTDTSADALLMEIARVKAELASLSGTSEHEESSSKRRKPATPTHAPAPQPAELDALTISAEIARLQAELNSLDSHDAQPLTLSALLLADPFAAPPPSTASEKIRIRHSELKLEAFEKHLLSITQHVNSLDKEIDAVKRDLVSLGSFERKHVAALHQQQSTLPSLSVTPSRRLYCICRTPFDKSVAMLQCDCCAEWYHPACLHLTRTITPFVCTACTQPPSLLLVRPAPDESVLLAEIAAVKQTLSEADADEALAWQQLHKDMLAARSTYRSELQVAIEHWQSTLNKLQHPTQSSSKHSTTIKVSRTPTANSFETPLKTAEIAQKSADKSSGDKSKGRPRGRPTSATGPDSEASMPSASPSLAIPVVIPVPVVPAEPEVILAPVATAAGLTSVSCQTAQGELVLTIGMSLDVKDSNGLWVEGVVHDFDTSSVLVHMPGRLDFPPEWISLAAAVSGRRLAGFRVRTRPLKPRMHGQSLSPCLELPKQSPVLGAVQSPPVQAVKSPTNSDSVLGKRERKPSERLLESTLYSPPKPHALSLSQLLAHGDECCVCTEGGKLVCCDGCAVCVHAKCAGLPKSSIENSSWFCDSCAGTSDQNPSTLLSGALAVGPLGRTCVVNPSTMAMLSGRRAPLVTDVLAFLQAHPGFTTWKAASTAFENGTLL